MGWKDNPRKCNDFIAIDIDIEIYSSRDRNRDRYRYTYIHEYVKKIINLKKISKVQELAKPLWKETRWELTGLSSLY